LFNYSQHIGRFLKVFHFTLSWTFATKDITASSHKKRHYTASHK